MIHAQNVVQIILFCLIVNQQLNLKNTRAHNVSTVMITLTATLHLVHPTHLVVTNMSQKCFKKAFGPVTDVAHLSHGGRELRRRTDRESKRESRTMGSVMWEVCLVDLGDWSHRCYCCSLGGSGGTAWVPLCSIRAAYCPLPDVLTRRKLILYYCVGPMPYHSIYLHIRKLWMYNWNQLWREKWERRCKEWPQITYKTHKCYFFIEVTA